MPRRVQGISTGDGLSPEYPTLLRSVGVDLDGAKSAGEVLGTDRRCNVGGAGATMELQSDGMSVERDELKRLVDQPAWFGSIEGDVGS